MAVKNNVPRMIEFVKNCDDPAKLRNIIDRAREAGESDLEIAASRRLYEVSSHQEPGTFEFDVWKSIHALEHALTTERNKTTRLQRTRNSVSDKGERDTVASLILKPKPSEGFGMLVDREMADLTFEAVAMCHRNLFSEQELNAAKSRLVEFGVLGN